MKKVIITGVTGQMGSYLVEHCLTLGLSVIGTVRRLSVPNHDNILHIKNDNFTIELMDLGDVHSINNLIKKYQPDYFINCAANSFVGDSWRCPEQHMEFNAIGVLRQLEAIKNFSPHTRYLNFGSSEEFGDVQYSPQNEKHPLRARSPYGASKIAARQIVKVYRESYNLYAIQPWCYNYESPRRGLEFVTRKISSGVADILQSLMRGCVVDPIELGNIEAKRDWSFAIDFVDGIWRMLNQDDYPQIWNANKQVPQEYILSSGETHTIKEFVELAFKNFDDIVDVEWSGSGLDQKLIAKNINQYDELVLVKINPLFYRPADVEVLLGDSTKIREELNWKPKCSFQQLVTMMCRADCDRYY